MTSMKEFKGLLRSKLHDKRKEAKGEVSLITLEEEAFEEAIEEVSVKITKKKANKKAD